MDVDSRHAAGQLLHGGAVVEGEVPRRDGDVAEAERQSDRDKVCGRQDGKNDGVRRRRKNQNNTVTSRAGQRKPQQNIWPGLASDAGSMRKG